MSYAIADEPYDHPRLTPAVQGILAVNVGIYFLQLTLMMKPEDMQLLLGFRMQDLQSAWWKALTYMFVHGGFMHLAGNMYMLWLFGPRVEHSWTTPSFLRFYLLCGLGGWLAHVLFVHDGLLMGASAAIYGVMYAYARQWKDEELYLFGVIPIKVKWLVVGYIALDLTLGMASMLSAVPTGTAHLAHIGGVLTAWLYLRTPSSQSLERLRQRINQIPDIPDEPPRAVPRQAPRAPRERGSEADEAVAKSKAIVGSKEPPRPARRSPAPPSPATPGSDLDVLLDKISEQGLDSLTSEERRRLEEASRKLKGE